MAHELNNIKCLLKDVVLVELLNPPTKRGILFLPDKRHAELSAMPVKVLKLGSKFRFKDEVKEGDIILVPSQFGNTLNRDNEAVRMFDGEDVLAIVTDYGQLNSESARGN